MAGEPTLNPALRDFWLQKADIRVLYGGRVSSKSWDAAGFAVFLAHNFRIRVLCTRQFQNKIADSVYTLLKFQIERFGLQEHFEIQRDKIIAKYTGSEFLFYGLWRSIDEVKSMEGIDILWIEEAHNLTEEQWHVLEPTIRKENSQIWILFNPRLANDFVYKRFVLHPPPNAIVRKINYLENPFLSEKIIRTIDALKAENYLDYEHVYLGVPKQDDESVIIKRSWIMAAIDSHLKLGFKPTGRKRIGFDVADSGPDKCALVYAHGSVVIWSDLWQAGEDELLKSCTRVFKAAKLHHANVTYDSIGVGASVGAKLAELNASTGDPDRVIYEKFNAGGSIWQPDRIYSGSTKNSDMFLNIKAQAWWLLADRFRNTFNAVRNGDKFPDDKLISLSSALPNLNMLIDELATPKRDYDANGRVKVESKKDLAKRDVPSPNLADAMVMTFAPVSEPLRITEEVMARFGTRKRYG